MTILIPALVSSARDVAQQRFHFYSFSIAFFKQKKKKKKKKSNNVGNEIICSTSLNWNTISKYFSTSIFFAVIFSFFLRLFLLGIKILTNYCRSILFNQTIITYPRLRILNNWLVIIFFFLNTNSEKYSSRFSLKNQERDESKENETNIQSLFFVETIASVLFKSDPKRKTKTNNRIENLDGISIHVYA